MNGSEILALWRGRGEATLHESGLETVRPEGGHTVAVNAVLAAADGFPEFRGGLLG